MTARFSGVLARFALSSPVMIPRASRSLCALFALAACAPEPKIANAIEHAGARVTLVVPPSVAGAASALSHLDALVSVASDALQLGSARHRVLVFPQEAWGECPLPRDYRRRCVAPSRVSIATDALDDNNVIRGLLWRAHAGHEMFASHLALALGDDTRDVSQWDGAWSAVAPSGAAPESAEWLVFLQWIIRVHGIAKTLAWYRATRPGERTEDVTASFDFAIGASFRDELARFRREGPRRRVTGAWSIAAMCRGAESLYVGDRIAAGYPSDDSVELRGRYSTGHGGDEGWVRVARDRIEVVGRFTVRDDRALRFTAIDADGPTVDPSSAAARVSARYSVVSCDRGEVEWGGSHSSLDAILRLRPGRYALRARAWSEKQHAEVLLTYGMTPSSTELLSNEPSFSRRVGVVDGWMYDSRFGMFIAADGHTVSVPLEAAPSTPVFDLMECGACRLSYDVRSDQWATTADGRRALVIRAPPVARHGERMELRVLWWNPSWGALSVRQCVERDRRLSCSDERLGDDSFVLSGLIVISAPARPELFALEISGGQFYEFDATP